MAVQGQTVHVIWVAGDALYAVIAFNRCGPHGGATGSLRIRGRPMVLLWTARPGALFRSDPLPTGITIHIGIKTGE
jgi:hypothetical protein